MYISDTEENAKRAAKIAFVYLLITLFLVLFGAVYEVFSHEVYSFYMLYAFAFPLVGGVLPFSVMNICRWKRYPHPLARNLYHSGIATLSIGSIVQGVLDIYGTTNSKTQVYWYVGILLVILGIVFDLWKHAVNRTQR